MKYRERIILICFTGWIMLSFMGFYLSGVLNTTDQPDQSELMFHRRSRDLADNRGISAIRHWAHYASQNETTLLLTTNFITRARTLNNLSDPLDLDQVYFLWSDFKSKTNIDDDTLNAMSNSESITHLQDVVNLADFIENVLVPTPKTTADQDEQNNAEDITDSEDRNANNEYQEPPSRALSEGMLNTLMSAVTAMQKVRKPRNDLGESLNIHDLDENMSEAQMPAWNRFQNNMRRHQLYSSDDPGLEEILDNLRMLPIVGMDTIPDAGTQTKMVFRLSDGSRVMAKPRRMPVDVEALTDTYQFDDFERFYAEIAAFHLDRILGFNRVPPVVSRYVNLTSEVRYYAPHDLKKTFYNSPVNNVCFYGVCSQFCDTPFGICGSPDLIPASFAFYLPSRNKADRYSWENPWKQSYSRNHPAPWKDDDGYCDFIMEDEFYQTTRRLLDIMDLAVFDFFQSNLDRHHFHTFEVFENDTNIFLYDNGRAFARSYRDEMGLLAPITQCCRIRLSTLDRLLKLYTDQHKLSDKLRRSLASETVRPLLTEKHLRAVDRRLVIVLESIYSCILNTDDGYAEVVQDDGF